MQPRRAAGIGCPVIASRRPDDCDRSELFGRGGVSPGMLTFGRGAATTGRSAPLHALATFGDALRSEGENRFTLESEFAKSDTMQ